MDMFKILNTDIEDLFKSKEELFTIALRSDNYKEAEKYIISGLNLDFEIEEYYETPLIYCCIYRPKLAKKIIENNSNINYIVPRTGNTAILTSARYGRPELVELLLKAGADINSKNNNSETPLIKAILNGRTALALRLIDMGADINIKNKDGNNALLLASGLGNTRIIKKLIEKRADINVQNNDGDTALIKAAKEKNVETMRLLLKNNADVNILNNNDYSPLIYAVDNGNIKITQDLIDHNANVYVVNKKSDTALSIAERKNLNKIIKIIKIAKGEYRDPNKALEHWQKMGIDRISFTGIYPEQKLKLVEIYNFAARERITMSEDLETNIKASMIVTSFNEIAIPAIEKALNQFEEKGGKADRKSVLNKGAIFKKDLKKLD